MLNASIQFWVVVFAIVVLFLFPVQYIALRLRDTRSNPPDPHLGRKSLLYFLFNTAVFLFLMGLTVSAMEVAEYLFTPAILAQTQRQTVAQNQSPDPQPGDAPPGTAPVPALPPRDWFNDQQRLAAGLTTSGLLHGLLFWVIVRLATNDRQFPAVRRAFNGSRLLVSALIVLVTSTSGLVVAFQRGEADYRAVSQILAISCIWGPVALLHLALLFWSSGQRTTLPAPVD